MKIKNEFENQISDSRRLAFFLSLAGGFQDAYSYICRGNVFANAQTGNIVLLSGHLISGQFIKAIHYIFPILAFLSGIYLTEWIQYLYKKNRILHWRQIILFFEIVAMVFVGCLPSSMNVLANIILSFSCAMQVSSFKKFRGITFATTMCIGNMRNATEFLAQYHIYSQKESIYKSLHYYGAIAIFSLGSSLGFIFSKLLGLISIWIAALFLFVVFILMLIKE